MTMKSPRPTLEPMPQPPVKPTIDNMEDEARVTRFMRLAHTYGPIFQLNLPGRQWVITANYELANELCDEKRFLKKHLPLRAVGQIVPTSIFVVSTTEPVWSKAHKIMLPLFSTQAMHAYLPKMWETTMPMILKWER